MDLIKAEIARKRKLNDELLKSSSTCAKSLKYFNQKDLQILKEKEHEEAQERLDRIRSESGEKLKNSTESQESKATEENILKSESHQKKSANATSITNDLLVLPENNIKLFSK